MYSVLKGAHRACLRLRMRGTGVLPAQRIVTRTVIVVPSDRIVGRMAWIERYTPRSVAWMLGKIKIDDVRHQLFQDCHLCLPNQIAHLAPNFVLISPVIHLKLVFCS